MRILEPNFKFKILGHGRSWPNTPALSNADLLARHPDSAGKSRAVLEALGAKIQAKYGHGKRHFSHDPWTDLVSGSNEATSESLAYEAAKKALADRASSEVDFIVMGTTTSSRYTGSQAAAIAGKLGVHAPALEVKSGCSTSLAALHTAFGFLGLGYSNVLVTCAETLSKVLHPEDRETWLGLSDGGAALWMGEAPDNPDFTLLKSCFSSKGEHVELFTTRGELPPRQDALESREYFMTGDSIKMAQLAFEGYIELIEQILPTPEERRSIRWVIPHQVNRSLTEQVLAQTNVSGTQVYISEDFASMGGASVLFTLVTALEKKEFLPGDRILLLSVGGGLSLAAQIWEKT